MAKNRVMKAIPHSKSYEKGVAFCNKNIVKIRDNWQKAGYGVKTKDAALIAKDSLKEWGKYYGQNDKSYQKGIEDALNVALTQGRLKPSKQSSRVAAKKGGRNHGR